MVGAAESDKRFQMSLVGLYIHEEFGRLYSCQMFEF